VRRNFEVHLGSEAVSAGANQRHEFSGNARSPERLIHGDQAQSDAVLLVEF
jgi:hypothetical protein